MDVNDKIGIIGVGKMGGSIAEGIVSSGVRKADHVVICDADSGQIERLKNKYGFLSDESRQLAADCRIVLICVKPHLVTGVLDTVSAAVDKSKLIISVAAGVTTSTIESHLPAGAAVVRVMPNIAAMLGESATVICLGQNCEKKHLDCARLVMGAVGQVYEVSENLMDAVTGLSGSGPAYVFAFTEALLLGALKVGIPHKEAHGLVVQTLRGAVSILEHSGSVSPAELRDQVTTPGGTTIYGLHELEKHGFRDAVISAVEAASRRSQELGKKD